ncbi:SDR family NAD(P)-dependent oxidoreductase, partial [Pseudomonas sp. S75]|uniref:SDR family NAD(P)-dependent oxidoreductase n=1 Tax=unclassified Pseudomonas TaxID=196821 RepID=UPI001906555F
LVLARGRLMQSLPAGGAMAAVRADHQVVEAAIAGFDGAVSIAAFNSPLQTVISGDANSVAHCCEILAALQVRTVQLSVSHAFHSARLDPILDDFEQVAAEVTYHSPKIPLISNLSSEAATPEMLCARYWRDHARQPVSFARSLETLASLNCSVWLEAGPHPVLMELAATQMPDNVRAMAMLNRRRDDWTQTLEALGAIYSQGYTPDWKAFHPAHASQQIELPSYAWDKKYFNYRNTSSTGSVKAVQHQPSTSEAELGDLTYQIEWIVQDRLITDASSQTDKSQPHWAIFLEDGPLSEAVLGKIRALDPSPLLLVRHDSPLNQELQALRLDTGDTTKSQAKLRSRITQDGRAISGVIYLWNNNLSCDQASHDVIGQTDNRTRDALFAMQLMLRLQTTLPHGFNMVTGGAIAMNPVINTEPGMAELTQAPLAGLMKTLSHEAPGLRPRLIDLPLHQDRKTTQINEDAQVLVDEIAFGGSSEFQIAFRDHKRHVARLSRKPLKQGRGIEIASDAAYLITGGLGEIGLKLCEWLVAHGARHLALVNRSGATTAQQHSTLAHLRSLGAKLTIHHADIRVEDEVLQLVETVSQGIHPLKGVFHCAGTSGAMTKLNDLHWSDLKRTMGAKVDATWSLYETSKALELDFFISFSSISAVWGASGLGAYAAANAFLDAFGSFTRNQAVPATAVNWGPWDRTGMANAPELIASLETSGIKTLDPDVCLNMLGTLLASGSRPITVTDTSWAQFRKVADVLGMGRMFNSIQSAVPATIGTPTIASSTPKGPEVTGLAPSDIEQYLNNEVGDLLGLPDRNAINRRTGFFDLGMDSVLAAELLARIKNSFNIDLPSTAIFENPTIQALSECIASRSPVTAQQQSSTFVEPITNRTDQKPRYLRTDIEQMSEQEALELLQATLRSCN